MQQLDRIENSLESLHIKLDSVCEKVAGQEATIGVFKLWFGGLATALLALVGYIFRSHS